MKITQFWRRNTPSSAFGESITLTTTYYSFDKREIDELETNLTKGMIVMDTDKSEEEQNDR